MSVDFLPLRNKGYLIVKNFLNENIINQLKVAYSKTYEDYLENGASMKRYAVLSSDGWPEEHIELKNQIRRMIGTMTRQILHDTGIDADLVPKFYPTFMDNKISPFDWHQDADTYFLWQNLFHSLNFYIPFIKPDPNKSGLTFIPMDNLRKKDLGFYNEYILNKGGSTLAFEDGKTQFYSFEEEKIITLNYDIRSMSISPSLNEGDLLLLRGDVIHKTQDTSTNRVAISIRTCCRRLSIDKKKFYMGGPRKINYMKTNPKIFKEVHEYFNRYPEKKFMPIFANYYNESRYGSSDGSY